MLHVRSGKIARTSMTSVGSMWLRKNKPLLDATNEVITKQVNYANKFENVCSQSPELHSLLLFLNISKLTEYFICTGAMLPTLEA